MTAIPRDPATSSAPLMHARKLGDGPVTLVFAHGWGHSGTAFVPIAEGLSGSHECYLLDLPGFGETPAPDGVWGTADYADHAASFLASLPRKPTVWIGHSNGGRIGIRLAERHPEVLSGLFLLASAGIPRPRPFWERAALRARIRGYKILKALAPNDAAREALRNRFGSTDYRSAGALRETMVRLINEDLTLAAAAIRLPVQLVYGRDDAETPPALGERLSHLIPGSSLTLLDGFGHNTILDAGRFQVQALLKSFAASVGGKAGS